MLKIESLLVLAFLLLTASGCGGGGGSQSAGGPDTSPIFPLAQRAQSPDPAPPVEPASLASLVEIDHESKPVGIVATFDDSSAKTALDNLSAYARNERSIELVHDAINKSLAGLLSADIKRDQDKLGGIPDEQTVNDLVRQKAHYETLLAARKQQKESARKTIHDDNAKISEFAKALTARKGEMRKYNEDIKKISDDYAQPISQALLAETAELKRLQAQLKEFREYALQAIDPQVIQQATEDEYERTGDTKTNALLDIFHSGKDHFTNQAKARLYEEIRNAYGDGDRRVAADQGNPSLIEHNRKMTKLKADIARLQTHPQLTAIEHERDQKLHPLQQALTAYNDIEGSGDERREVSFAKVSDRMISISEIQNQIRALHAQIAVNQRIVDLPDDKDNALFAQVKDQFAMLEEHQSAVGEIEATWTAKYDYAQKGFTLALDCAKAARHGSDGRLRLTAWNPTTAGLEFVLQEDITAKENDDGDLIENFSFLLVDSKSTVVAARTVQAAPAESVNLGIREILQTSTPAFVSTSSMAPGSYKVVACSHSTFGRISATTTKIRFAFDADAK